MTLIKKVKASGARLVLLTAPPYAKPGPEFPMGISAAEVDKLQAKAVPGVIHVEAASFAKTGGKISWGGQFPNVLVHDSFGGGSVKHMARLILLLMCGLLSHLLRVEPSACLHIAVSESVLSYPVTWVSKLATT
jgi:hypothetical protein